MEISLENLHVDINAERANHVSSMWPVSTLDLLQEVFPWLPSVFHSP